MRVGVTLFNFGPGASPDSLVRRARVAERLGYHLLMIPDHVAITPDVGARYPAPLYDPFITLGWLAGLTPGLALGVTVAILPYRHPLLTARMAANLDQLTGGRFILGVGVGWAEREFEALGVPFHRRGAMTDDYLVAIKTCWTRDLASHHGAFVSFTDVQTGPRPVRSPHPPVWVGGQSDAALRRAVRHGDAWHPIRVRVDRLSEQGLPRLREIAAGEGRPVPALCPRIRLRLTRAPLPEEGRLAGEGTLDQVRKDLAGLESLGASYVLLDTYTDDGEATRDPDAAWRMLETLAAQVLDLPRQALR